MVKKKTRFFIVQEDILPGAIQKTVTAKELLCRGKVNTINEAAEKVGLSRSTFYKYRNKVFPVFEWNRGRTVTIEMLLEHKSGVLSSVLQIIASFKGNIITINQSPPRQGIASATITVEVESIEVNAEQLASKLVQLQGVKQMQLIGHALET